MHALNAAGNVISRLNDIHHFQKVDETGKSNHSIFFFLKLLILQRRVKFKVVHQILVINGQN